MLLPTRVQLLLRLCLAIILFAIFQLSFLDFVCTIQEADKGKIALADAIVVFSGDPSRITRGFDLLIAGKAPLLFTAGVDNLAEINNLKEQHLALAQCCVDGEQFSRTTHEDAQAISQWIAGQGIRSVIVVTTNIHMPRALAEMNNLTKGVTFQPSGVTHGLYDSHRWADDPDIVPKLKTEWLKFVAARLYLTGG